MPLVRISLLEGSTPEYRKALTIGNVRAGGIHNIQAGVGYLLKVVAQFAMVPVKPAPKQKQHLAIVGWRPLTSIEISSRYNSGDSYYAQKLDYCLALITGKNK